MTTISNFPELLAPAGDRARLEAAVRFGADAVYLAGKTFGMRCAPENFTPQELIDAVDFCHKKGVKVYLTCNTLPTCDDVDTLDEYLETVKAAKVDALIIADIGIFFAVRRTLPDMEIHISTQAGIVNHLTAREFYNLGAKRIVLARELSLDEIKRIRDETPPELEIETFIHGAMCVSFSGRCLLSSYIAGRGRESNRGGCAQPCRWSYTLTEVKRPDEHYPIIEEDHGTYILNAKDLCMMEHLDKLMRAGISSFKIEGRAKSEYYTAVITNAYRAALDLLKKDPDHYAPEPWMLEETLKISHREYCTGFYFGQPDNIQRTAGYIREYDVVAKVDGSENGLLRCTELNRFSVGESVEIVDKGKPPVSLTISEMFDEEMQPLSVARHPEMTVFIRCEHKFSPGAMIRKKL
ncbi:MAG: U32 family peptidase [Ruminococcaceae bacterium]|nr:U32 family peptidase [Oscillospiraceae bacterium]